MTTKTRPKTRLDAFLRNAPFSMAALARKAAADMKHLREIRHGRNKRLGLELAERLRSAASELSGRDVDLSELFTVGPTPKAARK